MMRKKGLSLIFALVTTAGVVSATAAQSDKPFPDPATVIWSTHPADKWENAYPVGNGRIGAMVFGKTDEEQVQILSLHKTKVHQKGEVEE